MWNFIFRQTKIGKYLDGKKSFLGLVVLAVYYLAMFLVDASVIMPEVKQFPNVLDALFSFMGLIMPYIGGLLTGFGFTDKVVKYFENKKKAKSLASEETNKLQ